MCHLRRSAINARSVKRQSANQPRRFGNGDLPVAVHTACIASAACAPRYLRATKWPCLAMLAMPRILCIWSKHSMIKHSELLELSSHWTLISQVIWLFSDKGKFLRRRTVFLLPSTNKRVGKDGLRGKERERERERRRRSRCLCTAPSMEPFCTVSPLFLFVRPHTHTPPLLRTVSFSHWGTRCELYA